MADEQKLTIVVEAKDQATPVFRAVSGAMTEIGKNTKIAMTQVEKALSDAYAKVKETTDGFKKASNTAGGEVRQRIADNVSKAWAGVGKKNWTTNSTNMSEIVKNQFASSSQNYRSEKFYSNIFNQPEHYGISSAVDLAKRMTRTGSELAGDSEDSSIDKQVRKYEILASVYGKLGQAVQIAGKALDGFWQISKKTLSVIGKLGVSIAKVPISLISKGFSSLKDSIHRTNERLSRFVRQLGRIVVYRAFRAFLGEIAKGFSEGVKNLYGWSSGWEKTSKTFKASMDSMTTSLTYLRNSVAAAVEPLANYFAPVIDALVDKIVNLINTVNQFLSTISGASTWTRALKYEKAFEDGAKKAGSALKKQVFGFDELNILSDPSGKGGSTAEDYSKMFETMETALDTDSLFGRIRKNIAEGDWSGVGDALGEGLNRAFLKLKAGDIGSRIGNVIQKGILMVNAFFDKAHWGTLGKAIADQVSALFDSITPESVGKSLTNSINAIIEFAQGFLTNWVGGDTGDWLAKAINSWFDNINWGGLVQSIDLFIDDMIDFGQKFIEGFNWEQNAQRITSKVNELVSMINWDGLGATIGGFAQGLITTAKTFVTEFDWVGFANSLARLTNNMISHIDWKDLGQTVNSFVRGVLKGALEYIRDVDWEKVGESIYNFLSQIDFVGIFLDIGKLILSAIKGMLRAINAGVEASGLNNYGKGSMVGDHGNNAVVKFASGGYPTQGSMFIAGEAGAEFVGNINGKTGVMNTDQFGAVMQPTTEAIYAIGSAIVGAVNGIEMPSVRIGDRDIYKASKRGERLTGSSLVVGAR